MHGIHISDMLAIPDPATFCLDPFFKEPTVSVIANIVDPITAQGLHADPRHCEEGRGVPATDRDRRRLLHRSEPEFFVFDEVRYEQNQHKGYYEIDSWRGPEHRPDRGAEPGVQASFKGGISP